DERHELLRVDEEIAELLRRELALLREQRASVLGDALHASLDRDAPGAPEELEHVRRPVVDPHLDTEDDVARGERFEELAIGDEDLVDEVDVAHTLRDEIVELAEDRRERAL